MGYITLFVLAFTAISLAFGALYGCVRGRNRAILRLVIVLACIVAAVLARGFVVEKLMAIEISDGKSLQGMLEEAFTSGDANIPAQLQDLVFTLVEIIGGLIVFFLLFFVLRVVSIILFMILKIWVKKGEKKRKGMGALVGLLQGAIIAFVICAPITGIFAQVDKISHIQLNNKPLFELPKEIGITEYIESVPGKIYGTTGNWFFNLVSSGETADGKDVSIEDTCDIVVAVSGIADTVTNLTTKLENIDPDASPEEHVNTMKDIGNSLVEIGNSLNNLSTDAKEMVNDMIDSVKEIITNEGGEDIPPEVEEFLDNFNIDNINFVATGKAINGIASFVEKTELNPETSAPVTQEEVNDIVNGLAANEIILDMISSAGGEGEDMQLAEIEDATHRELFTNAITNTTLSDENKDMLKNLFGLNN